MDAGGGGVPCRTCNTIFIDGVILTYEQLKAEAQSGCETCIVILAGVGQHHSRLAGIGPRSYETVFGVAVWKVIDGITVRSFMTAAHFKLLYKW